MKRLLSVLVVLATFDAAGCCCNSFAYKRDWTCGDGECGLMSGRLDCDDKQILCGGDQCTSCGDWTQYSLSARIKHLFCGAGCGERYWGDYISYPPDKCDPCDHCGNFTGYCCLPRRVLGTGCGGCGWRGCGSCGCQPMPYGPANEPWVVPPGAMPPGTVVEPELMLGRRSSPSKSEPRTAVKPVIEPSTRQTSNLVPDSAPKATATKASATKTSATKASTAKPSAESKLTTAKPVTDTMTSTKPVGSQAAAKPKVSGDSSAKPTSAKPTKSGSGSSKSPTLMAKAKPKASPETRPATHAEPADRSVLKKKSLVDRADFEDDEE